MSVKGLYLESKTPKEQRRIKLLSDIAFAYLHFLDVRVKKYLVNYQKPEKPVIYAVWHGCQWALGLFPLQDRKQINILISLSNDGEMIARVCHLMGFSLVRGSQGRQGEKATRDILHELQNGNNIAFMVDGPKGPKQKVKKGIIRLAKMSNAPIVPIVPYTKQKICFNSWDNFQLPYGTWAKMSMMFGKPIYVTDEDDEEAKRLELEQALFDLEKDVIIEHRHYFRG